jgi:hypothetical protein
MMLFSHIHGFAQMEVNGIPLVISGGAGAKLEQGERYHWVRVEVKGAHALVKEVPLN